MEQKTDVNVKIETYVKVIMELGVEEARLLHQALFTAPDDSPTDPLYWALDSALRQIPEEAAA